VIHRTRAVVGRPETQTPVFSDSMSFIVFNPSWHVPLSIVRRSMVGPASRSGGYFARRGIQVMQGGRLVDASTINWASANIGRYSFRQPPGTANALGRMKFMFPNRHAIYLHDTPSRSDFARSGRTLSNGCVRVQNPEELAELLLGIALPGDNWSIARMRGIYGSGERTVRFRQQIPIHLVYFTMTVDSTGALVELPDIYGHNARVRTALTGVRG
jgi:L,D-transpeptidase YcbB